MAGEEPTIQTAKFTPVQALVTSAEDLLASAYTKLTPTPVDKALRANKVVLKGCQIVQSTRKYAGNLIARVDNAADGAKFIVFDTVSNFKKSIKDFYSSENNDYARIILRFLTLAIPNPQLLASTTLEKFSELFRYDPQFGTERFSKILGSFFKQAREHWLVDKTSKPMEIVRNSLYLVAFTMEELHIPYTERVPFFAQKLADYFMVDHQPKNLFKRKSFRAHFSSLLQLDALNESQQTLSDQFLQIASVLFGLTSVGNKDVIDRVIALFKYASNGFDTLFGMGAAGLSRARTSVSTAVAVPVKQAKIAYDLVLSNGTKLLSVSKDGVITIWTELIDNNAFKTCLKMIHQVNEYFRENGKQIVSKFRANEKVFTRFVSEHKEELVEFIEQRGATLKKFSQPTIDAALETVRKFEGKFQHIAETGKDVTECIYEASAKYISSSKAKLAKFVEEHIDTIKEETESLTHVIFDKLNLQEVCALVVRYLKLVEEYFSIKERLFKLDFLLNKEVVAVEKSHLLGSRLEAPAEAAS